MTTDSIVTPPLSQPPPLPIEVWAHVVRQLPLSPQHGSTLDGLAATLRGVASLRLVDRRLCGAVDLAYPALRDGIASGLLAPALLRTAGAGSAQLAVALGRARTLHLTDYQLSPYNGVDFDRLRQALDATPHLEGLALQRNALGHMVGQLTEALLPRPQLRRLNVAGNELAGYLSDLPLARFGLLRALDLRQNNLAASDVAALPLADLPLLEELNLAANRLGSRGVRKLALAALPRLRVLDLRANDIGSSGAGCLPLGCLPALERLDSAYNRLGDRGAAALRLHEAPRLQALDLTANGLRPAGAAALNLAACVELQVLRLAGNDLGPDAGAYVPAGTRDQLRVFDGRANGGGGAVPGLQGAGVRAGTGAGAGASPPRGRNNRPSPVFRPPVTRGQTSLLTTAGSRGNG